MLGEFLPDAASTEFVTLAWIDDRDLVYRASGNVIGDSDNTVLTVGGESARDDSPGLFVGSYLVRQASPVPLPAAFWLFGSALAGLGLITRKRKGVEAA